MKILVCFLLTLGSSLCEVPPPYPSRAYRTSQQSLPSPPRTRYGVPTNEPFRQLQTVYGPPRNAEPLDPSFQQPADPAKFRILAASPYSKYKTPRQPQIRYGPPRSPDALGSSFQQAAYPAKIRISLVGKPQSNLVLPSSSRAQIFQPNPRIIYGTPKIVNGAQAGFQKQQFSPAVVPQRLYGVPGVPSKPSSPQLQTNSVPSSQAPQSTYGPPRVSPQSELQREYGAPSIDSATVEEIRQLRLLIQKIEAQRVAQTQNGQPPSQYQASFRHAQSLPNRVAESFRFSPSQQYLPVKEVQNFKENAYLEFNQQSAPQNTYNAPPTNYPSNGNQNPPQNSYNSPPNNYPSGINQNIPQNNYNTPPSNYPSGGNQNIPQNNYNAPPSNYPSSGNQNAPQNNYNAPLSSGNQPAPSNNYLPSQNDNRFKTESGGVQGRSKDTWNTLDLPDGSDVDVQKVEVTQFGPRNRNKNNEPSSTFSPVDNESVNNKYIPPATENPVRRKVSPTTASSVDTSTFDDASSTEDDVTETPNVAVATAVAGVPNDQQYYLLNADGSYQRITSPESGIQSSEQNRYLSNYQVLQNLQGVPNVLYTPLYTVLSK